MQWLKSSVNVFATGYSFMLEIADEPRMVTHMLLVFCLSLRDTEETFFRNWRFSELLVVESGCILIYITLKACC